MGQKLQHQRHVWLWVKLTKWSVELVICCFCWQQAPAMFPTRNTSVEISTLSICIQEFHCCLKCILHTQQTAHLDKSNHANVFNVSIRITQRDREYACRYLPSVKQSQTNCGKYQSRLPTLVPGHTPDSLLSTWSTSKQCMICALLGYLEE